MPKRHKAPKQSKKPVATASLQHKKKHRSRSIMKPLSLRRFFMPNIDKIVKSLLNEMEESKEVMKAGVRNQEKLIQQNDQIIDTLEKIYNTVGSKNNR